MDLIFSFIYLVGGLICHQKPERSFFWGVQQFPVCARCTGLYLSGGAGFLFWVGLKIFRGWPRITIDPRIARNVLVVAALPTALSVATGAIGVWDGSNVMRALLAIPLGASAGAIVAAAAAKDLR